jgi:hypothetical protein
MVRKTTKLEEEKAAAEAKAVELIVAGSNRAQVIEAIRVMFPSRDAEKVLAEAVEMVAGTVYQPMDFLLGKCLLQLDDLGKRARMENDLFGARDAVVKAFAILKHLDRPAEQKKLRKGKTPPPGPLPARRGGGERGRRGFGTFRG